MSSLCFTVLYLKVQYTHVVVVTNYGIGIVSYFKLLQAPRGKQLKISGNVVNAPADITDTVHILPRVESTSGTIKVQLKRKLKYKSSALSLNVRPHKVFLSS